MRTGRLGVLVLALTLAACGGGEYQVDLMPAPAVYADGALSPFPADFKIESKENVNVYYATLREPAGAEADARSPYLDQRGQVARLGVGTVNLVSGPTDWEQILQLSFATERDAKYRLRLTRVDDFGLLDDSITGFVDPALLPPDPAAPGRRFAQAINAELRRSRLKDILVYVHGYKVPFADPLLVSTELWHFLGYEGAVVAFSWPSTPSRFAYFADLDTASASAFGFRKFLQFLARETEVERIHILGYSAGTRLVALTVNQLSLISKDPDPAAARARTKLGQVVLVGGDIDRQLVANFIADGLLDSVEGLNVYMSKKDKALGVSRILLTYDRLGQMFEEELDESTKQYILAKRNLHLINATEAEGVTRANGHGYFYGSPWASSDILSMVRYGLSPGERGLVRAPGSPVWGFPPDYVERLQRAILKKQAEESR